jgi:predicted nucleic acid-binding Zn ribbon protein
MNSIKISVIVDTELKTLHQCDMCYNALQSIPTTKKTCSAKCRVRSSRKNRGKDVTRATADFLWDNRKNKIRKELEMLLPENQNGDNELWSHKEKRLLELAKEIFGKK